MQVAKYFHTVRYLKAIQIFARLLLKIKLPKVILGFTPALRSLSETWVVPVNRQTSMKGAATFCFLNDTKTIKWPNGWNDPAAEKLWLYNLHYFDDLNAKGADKRHEWHQELIDRWIADNPPGKGNGWDPYPTSLRIINWIKWYLAGNTLSNEAVDSLAVQVRWLRQNLEYHLLGNHLFANAKALVFAGFFFSGLEAHKWICSGLDILQREIPEQILPDGGQFERSSMYHCIALEDLCDLVNICRGYLESVPENSRNFVDSWPGIVRRMFVWLKTMCHPDGRFVLFNDSAFGIAPEVEQLEQYCRRLEIQSIDIENLDGFRVTELEDTGYIRVDHGGGVSFLDAAPLGPDYQPAHAHADTLTFELSLFGKRVIVDTGTSCYGIGSERLRQRSTAAHNTVTVDGNNSSEVWSGFRVARRAHPLGLKIQEEKEYITVQCSHNGYKRLPGRPLHTRRWEFSPGLLRIRDVVSQENLLAQARLHIHPQWQCHVYSPTQADLILSGEKRVRINIHGGKIVEEQSTWHPQFGLTLENNCLAITFYRELVTDIGWNT